GRGGAGARSGRGAGGGAGPPAGERGSRARAGSGVAPALRAAPAMGPTRTRLEALVHQKIVAWDADTDAGIAAAWEVNASLGLADPDFAPLREHPLVADAVAALLGPDTQLRELTLRAPLPGFGHQGLHHDFANHRTDGIWQSLSA